MQDLCALLRQASRLITSLFDGHLKDISIRTGQVIILDELSHYDRLIVSELGKRLSIDRTTISRNVKKIASKDWVRERETQDQRSKIFCLTDDGMTKLNESKPHWIAANDKIITGMQKDDYDELKEKLIKLIETLKRI